MADQWITCHLVFFDIKFQKFSSRSQAPTWEHATLVKLELRNKR